jgi:hypothetical protein
MVPRVASVQHSGAWLAAGALALGALAATAAARAQDCPEDMSPCCGSGPGGLPGYLADGDTNVSRWTPILRDTSFTVSDEDGTPVPWAQGVSVSPCGELFIPSEPLRPNHTYTVLTPYSPDPDWHFTTGESDEQSELLVEIGEDQDPDERFYAEVRFSRPPVIRAVEDGRWVYSSTYSEAARPTLYAGRNEFSVTFVGAEGQYVVMDIEGVYVPPDDDDLERDGCVCQAAAGARARAWSWLPLLLAAAAVGRRRFAQRRAQISPRASSTARGGR